MRRGMPRVCVRCVIFYFEIRAVRLGDETVETAHPGAGQYPNSHGTHREDVTVVCMLHPDLERGTDQETPV